MKTKFFFLFLLIEFMLLFEGWSQEKRIIKSDTIRIVQLHNHEHADAVIQIILEIEGERDKTEQRFLEIQKEGMSIEKVILPIPDEEVKNFEIENIVEINNGFIVEYSWGGGHFFYGGRLSIKFIRERYCVKSAMLWEEEITESGLKKNRTKKKIHKIQTDSSLKRLRLFIFFSHLIIFLTPWTFFT